ncbi:MAG: lipoate--protein ligase family protein [Spirochaetales bacterium]|nr:lipoate--protein ligase family protein [Spirochaetales bacterium]
MTLLLYDTGIRSAALNMAIDDVLLEKTEPVLRFYQWSGTAITLGRFQRHREVNTKAAIEDGIPVIRRETGGKAVLHGKDFTVSLILDKNRTPGSIKESIKPVAGGIIHGLHLLGINALQVPPGERRHSSPYCFSIHSPYEVVAGMKKIAGIAGRVYRDRVLYQISIPFTVNINMVKKYFYQADSRIPYHGTCLEEILPVRCVPELIKNAFIAGFKESMDAEMIRMVLTQEELNQAEMVAAEKFGRDQWNLTR